jgi:hypothetical protein
MNRIWQNPLQISSTGESGMANFLFAQTTPTVPASPATNWLQQSGIPWGASVLNLLGAIAILIVGWLIAVILASITRNLLKRTEVDNRLVSSMRGSRPGEAKPNVEKWASTVVFWIVLIIALVAFLDALKLQAVTRPLNSFLDQIFTFLPKLGGAAILLGVAWVLATLAKAIVIRTAQSLSLDRRLVQPEDTSTGDLPPENQFLLSETLGNALYWFIFLFFLPLILGVLDLQGPLQPVQNLLNELLAALPRILKALLIGTIGWFIARIVRSIVTNLLTAAGTDRLGGRLGLGRTTSGSSLSGLIGTVIYVLILIPTAIAALDALEIQAISTPAVAMLNEILKTIPQIFTAGLVLVVGYTIGQFVAELVTNILTSVGFNNIFSWLGLPSSVPPPASSQPILSEPVSPQNSRTPSEVAGIVVQIGIILFAAVAATNILNIPALSQIVTGLLVILGRIVVGLVVFAIGLYLANLAFSLITSSGAKEARLLGQAARIAIIALVAAMALQQMGIASDIVNLAFGLLLGAIAVAAALSFGLGGRDIAAEKIREWLASFRQN